MRRISDRLTVRLVGGISLMLAGATLLQSAAGQQPGPMSPSVVLVLKLVSSTLVKPTTGVVVSDDGTVLVPAAFAAEAGEMIVLDGGTDIASNGRPAKLVSGPGQGELALLSVKGLKRPGIRFSANLNDTADALHLEAFPPAEEIAKGARPLNRPVKTVTGPQSGQYSVSAETPLPYVTGAFLDDCGQLAGLSLAAGPQSLDSGKPTAILMGAALRVVLDNMQVTLPSAACPRKLKKAEAPVAIADQPRVAVPAQKPAESTTQTVQGDAVPDQVSKPVVSTPIEASPGNAAAVTSEPATAARVTEPAAIWQEVPAWLWILAVTVIGLGAWKIVYFFGLGKPTAAQPDDAQSAIGVQPVSDEPDTAPLADANDGTVLKPRSAPIADFELPETATKPEGCDGLLLVEGLLDDDVPFKRFCFVDTGRIDVVIGRGSADIAIEHAAISRNHARVKTDGERLTISDLGSRNGSFIGDVPCLAGEVMYLETGADVFLGDVKITIGVVQQEAQWA